jgi:F0F1-type ATP synthase assembly protein I
MAAQERRSEAWSGMGTGWAVTSTMIGGIAAWGAIGYLVDRLAGTHHVFLPVGFVLGAVGAVYLVWLRYGRGEGGGSGT